MVRYFSVPVKILAKSACRPVLLVGLLYARVNRAYTQKPNPFMGSYLSFASFRVRIQISHFDLYALCLLLCRSDRLCWQNGILDKNKRVSTTSEGEPLLFFFFFFVKCNDRCFSGRYTAKLRASCSKIESADVNALYNTDTGYILMNIYTNAINIR